MAVSTLFVTTASTETLNGTISGVTFICYPPCPNNYTTPNVVPLSKQQLTMYICSLHKQDRTPTNIIVIHAYVAYT